MSMNLGSVNFLNNNLTLQKNKKNYLPEEETSQRNINILSLPNASYGKAQVALSKKMDRISIDNNNPRLALDLFNKPEVLENIYSIMQKNLELEMQKETDEKKKQDIKKMQEIVKAGQKGLEEIKKSPDAIKNIKSIEDPSFKGWATSTKAHLLINATALAQAGIAATLAQAPGGDVAALLAVTTTMGIALGKIYDYSFTKATFASAFAPVIASSMGPVLASKALTWIPGAGNAVNAAVAFGVTEVVGYSLMGMFELMKKDGVDPDKMTQDEIKSYIDKANNK